MLDELGFHAFSSSVWYVILARAALGHVPSRRRLFIVGGGGGCHSFSCNNSKVYMLLIYMQFWIFNVHSSCFPSIELAMHKLDFYAMELWQTKSLQCKQAWFHMPFCACQYVYYWEMVFMRFLNIFYALWSRCRCFMLILDIMWMKLKSLSFEYIKVAACGFFCSSRDSTSTNRPAP